jgi:uncharacterized membrane protein
MGNHGIMVWFRNKFLAGLALALPLVITFVILQFIYSLLHGWSEPIVKWFADLANEIAGKTVIGTEDPRFLMATRFIGVLIPIAALIALGFMATNFIGAHVVTAFDRLMLRIPFVSFIYKSLKQVIDSFKSLGGAQNFKRVAYIDYPVPGMRLIAFVTGQFTDAKSGKAMTAVFIPTAPNPMSGLLLIVDSEKVTDAPLNIEDAMKLIFSGGLLVPETGIPPLNQRPVVPTGEEALPLPDDSDSQPDLSEPEVDPTLTPVLKSLPRAEDFDSGDPDILADADLHTPQPSASRSVTKRLASVLTWKRR